MKFNSEIFNSVDVIQYIETIVLSHFYILRDCHLLV